MTKTTELSTQLNTAAYYGGVALLFASSAVLLYKTGMTLASLRKAQPNIDNDELQEQAVQPDTLYSRLTKMIPNWQ